jgi:hypothetical protein
MLRTKFLFICYILIFALVGCFNNKRITNNGYTIVKGKRAFKLKDKFNLEDSLLLSTNQVYLRTCYQDTWFKFYRNGRVILNPAGWAGYYKIESGHLKIEITYIQEFVWDVLVLDGEISGDTIKFYKDHYYGRRHNIGHFTQNEFADCKYYVKSDKTFSLKDPDW